MNKKYTKRGFTIIELVIVIAIVAILAAVLIPIFSDLVKKANISSDTQLVKNLNTILAINKELDGQNKTPTEAIQDAQDGGFIVSKLTPTTHGYDIMWDSVNDRFVLLDDTENKAMIYPKEEVARDNAKYFALRSYSKMSDTDVRDKYSIYLTGEETITTAIPMTKGIDVGKNTVSTINYTNSDSAQDVIIRTVVIRTNSVDTALTVNGPSDDIKHYGIVGDLTVTAVRSDHCYHENGFVVNLASFGTGKFVVEPTALFHQTKDQVAALFEGETKSYVEGKDAQYSQHVYDAEGVCIVDGCYETTATHVHSWGKYEHDETTHWRVCSSCGARDTAEAHTITYSNNTGDTHDEICSVCGYTKTGVTHTFVNGVCACGKAGNIVKNGLVDGYYYLNDELYTGTINDNNKTIAFENGCLVVWAEDSLEGSDHYIVNHTFNKSSVDEKYLTDKIVLSSISSVDGTPGSQTRVSNKIKIDFSGYSVESAKAYDPSIMYSLSSTPWNNATVYADYMKLISETCGNKTYGDPSTFPFYINSKDYTEYQLLSISELTFTDYLKLKYVSNIIVTSSTTAIETYLVKAGSEDKLSAYAYDNGKAGMGIILSRDGKAYFYSWSDLEPCFPSYIDISSNNTYSGYGYSVNRNGATITVSYKGTPIDTLTLTNNTISNFNLNEQKTAISGMSIADSCSIEELLALATDPSGSTEMRIDQAPEVLELFIKAFWSTYSFSNASGNTTCSFDDFNADFLNNNSFKYVVQFVNGIGNAYQGMEHVGPIIKIIISKN